MEKMLVSPSPQIRDNISTSKVMTHVLVALCPALAMSAYVFGGRALMLTSAETSFVESGLFIIRLQSLSHMSAVIMQKPVSISARPPKT